MENLPSTSVPWSQTGSSLLQKELMLSCVLDLFFAFKEKYVYLGF